MTAWADVPQDRRAVHRRGMEIFAGFVEYIAAHVDLLVAGVELRSGL
jgi:hypothetical protein